MRDIEKLTRVKPTELPLPENFLVEQKRLPLPKLASKDDRERDALGARGRDEGRGGRGGGRGRPQHGQVHRGGTNRETSRDASPRGPVGNPLGGRGTSGQPRSNWSPVEANRPDRGERPAGGDRPRGDRPQGARPQGGRPQEGRSHEPRSQEGRPGGGRPPRGRGGRPGGGQGRAQQG